MAINIASIINSFCEGQMITSEAIDAIVPISKAVKKHERSATSFMRELHKLDDEALSKCVKDMAGSWKLEVSKTGVSSDALMAYADAIHSYAKSLRLTIRKDLMEFHASKDYNKTRSQSVHLVAIEGLLSSVSNFKDSYSKVVEAIAIAA